MDKQLTRMIIAGVTSGLIILALQGVVRRVVSNSGTVAFTPKEEFYT